MKVLFSKKSEKNTIGEHLTMSLTGKFAYEIR